MSLLGLGRGSCGFQMPIVRRMLADGLSGLSGMRHKFDAADCASLADWLS